MSTAHVTAAGLAWSEAVFGPGSAEEALRRIVSWFAERSATCWWHHTDDVPDVALLFQLRDDAQPAQCADVYVQRDGRLRGRWDGRVAHLHASYRPDGYAWHDTRSLVWASRQSGTQLRTKAIARHRQCCPECAVPLSATEDYAADKKHHTWVLVCPTCARWYTYHSFVLTTGDRETVLHEWRNPPKLQPL